MRTIVIGDLHGDWWGLTAILRTTGAVDDRDVRRPDTRVIQLGDLIHGGEPRGQVGPGVDDRICLELGLAKCDEILIGNHELPHAWPDARFPTFGGQRPIGDGMRFAMLGAYRAGVLVAATSVGDWLLTHAGVHPQFIGWRRSAPDVVKRIRERFAVRVDYGQREGLTDGVGRWRGGSEEFGGLFWCDWRELTAMASPIAQIVGHTPQGDAPRRDGNRWGVDVGAALSGKACALVTDDDGATWEPIVVRSEEGR